MKKAWKLDGNLTLLVIRSLKTGETLVVTPRQYREAAESVLAYARRKQIELAIIRESNPEDGQTLEKIARALFNPKLIELYPSMRWENLPDDIRKAYLDRASDVIAKMEELGYHKPPKGVNWNKVEDELTGGLSEFVGWDTRLIVKSNLMPVVKKLCTLLPR